MKQNKKIKITTTFLLVLAISLMTVGCSGERNVGKGDVKGIKDIDPDTATPREQQYCETDTDCVPIPTCHPRACINKEFTDRYKKPDVCTEMYDCSAAYDKEDCFCQNGQCMNKNLGGKGCPETPA